MATAAIPDEACPLIVGAIARFVFPGRQNMGLMKTTLLGIAGSFAGSFAGGFVGGFVGWLIFGGSAFQASGWIGSILGAVIVLAIAMRQSRSAA